MLKMKVCVWNINKATKKRDGVWQYLLKQDADIILLQEVNSIPKYIESKYDIIKRNAITKSDTLQKFSTAILVKGKIKEEITLKSEYEWVNKELKRFNGNLVALKIILNSGVEMNILSVYSPAWVVKKDRWKDIDVSGIKLDNNSDIWVTEILYAALLNENLNNNQWIIAGDFNSSPTFDLTFSSGNQEILDRMKNIGLYECLEGYNKHLVPTFKNAKGGKIIHQMDHIFVTKDIYQTLVSCNTEEHNIIFDNSLSDHLPIIGNFK